MKFHIVFPLVNNLWSVWSTQPKPIIWPQGSPSMGYRFTDTDTSMSEWPGLKDVNSQSTLSHLYFQAGPISQIPTHCKSSALMGGCRRPFQESGAGSEEGGEGQPDPLSGRVRWSLFGWCVFGILHLMRNLQSWGEVLCLPGCHWC